MSFVNSPNGAQIAEMLPSSDSLFARERADVRTLADLLEHLNSQPTSQTPMLRSTAAKIAAFLAKPADDISLDLIHMNREGFRPFLESRKHKEGAVRSYVNYMRILMEAAQALGWVPCAHLSSEWQTILSRAKTNECLSVAKWLAQTKSSPQEVTQDDFDRWVLQRTMEGRRYSHLEWTVNSCWRTLIACGYTKNAPLGFFRKKKYGVPLSEFPQQLKDEVTEVIRWKTAEFEPERPKRAQIRAVSATSVRQTLSALYGFATKVADIGEIRSLEQLIRKSTVAGFISWCINEQKIQGRPLVSELSSVLAAVSKHPAHRAIEVSWFRPLLEAVPIETYEDVKARKARKYLDYAVLESIPAKIRADRYDAAKHGEEHVARLVMGELMVAWLLVFPWRQRNIRECRVAGPNPNLFKAKVPAFSYIDKPEWACLAEAANANAEFWQVKFSQKETKTRVPIHCLVPRHLVGLLEEYLSRYRPILLNGRKCDTLFVPRESDVAGKAFVSNLISELTLRYGGRRVTPHLFRDIVAFAWLKEHAKDYLTLSKMLWHNDVSTTIKYYGSRFNESSASVAMEAWHDQRAKASTQGNYGGSHEQS
ncbi:MAG TPA: site-specific integrase [Terriglobales bacterium]|nr:site-specific integrase [Terriglobales bacterium]